MARIFAPYRAGDLIGFSSRTALGAAIKLDSWGIPRWGLSHVAILADHPDFPAVPLLFESTTTATAPCLIGKLHTRGVQAHAVEQKILDCDGRIWHYPLCHPLVEWQRETLTDYLCGLIENHVDYDALGAFRSRETPLGFLERWLCGAEENLASLFCSELVAAAWREILLWTPANASRWTPNALARARVRQGVCQRPRRVK